MNIEHIIELLQAILSLCEGVHESVRFLDAKVDELFEGPDPESDEDCSVADLEESKENSDD